MKYVLGNTFKVVNTIKPKGGSLLAQNIKLKSDKIFSDGAEYSLYNIKPIKEGVVYTFLHRSGNGIQPLEVTFSSVSEADARIDKLQGII